jgi:hypothetical protein
MNSLEIKKLIISSLDSNSDPEIISRQLEDEGISFDFKEGFTDRVINKIFYAGLTINREVEFAKSLNLVFSRIALTGVAAIVFLLISLYLMEGSFSLNSLLGLSDSYDESIVCLLTGN